VVTLGDNVGSAAELKLASKFSDDVNGVKGVKNRMAIEKSGSRTKEKAIHTKKVLIIEAEKEDRYEKI
jgi:osmotically-inducible protein OsmY